MPTPVSRQSFLSAPKNLKTEAVPVPEFGPDAVVIVSEMTVAERASYYAAITEEDAEGKVKMRAGGASEQLLIAACRDADGLPLFQAADVGVLGSFPGGLIARITAAAQRLSGLTKEAQEETKGN